MDQLIFKYLSDELNASEWKDLKCWLDEEENNRIYFNKVVAYWRSSNGKAERARENVLRKVVDSSPKKDFLTGSTKQQNLLKIAASFLLIATLIFFLYEKGFLAESNEKEITLLIEKETNPGQQLTTKLPDGSIVILNSGTRLKFPEKFDNSTRVVELEGEAFFDVVHEADRPFLVKSNGSVVKVLGTSFNVRTYSAESTINVAVATGRVSFTPPNVRQGVILSPNQMISYEVNQRDLTIIDVDPMDVFGWKDKILYFKDDELNDIIKELELWYGVKIVAEKDFSHKGNFTGEFKNKSLENVLIGLSYLYEFEFTIEGENVRLK